MLSLLAMDANRPTPQGADQVTATYAGNPNYGLRPVSSFFDFPLKLRLRHLAGLVQAGCAIEMLLVLVALGSSAAAWQRPVADWAKAEP